MKKLLFALALINGFNWQIIPMPQSLSTRSKKTKTRCPKRHSGVAAARRAAKRRKAKR